MYLFFDEVQRIPDWENAVNSFRVDFDCDIYTADRPDLQSCTHLCIWRALCSRDLCRKYNRCAVYITGSNAYLLSSELSTYLSGRYVEIKVLPLSFREFLDFHGYSITERKSSAGGMRKRITDADGEIYEVQELFDTYSKRQIYLPFAITLWGMRTIFARNILRLHAAKIGIGNVIRKRFMTFPIYKIWRNADAG